MDKLPCLVCSGLGCDECFFTGIAPVEIRLLRAVIEKVLDEDEPPITELE